MSDAEVRCAVRKRQMRGAVLYLCQGAEVFRCQSARDPDLHVLVGIQLVDIQQTAAQIHSSSVVSVLFNS